MAGSFNNSFELAAKITASIDANFGALHTEHHDRPLLFV